MLPQCSLDLQRWVSQTNQRANWHQRYSTQCTERQNGTAGKARQRFANPQAKQWSTKSLCQRYLCRSLSYSEFLGFAQFCAIYSDDLSDSCTIFEQCRRTVTKRRTGNPLFHHAVRRSRGRFVLRPDFDCRKRSQSKDSIALADDFRTLDLTLLKGVQLLSSTFFQIFISS